MLYSKKGLSDIVATVLIILLVVVAVAVIWAFIRPTLESAGSGLQKGQVCLTSSVEPLSCVRKSANGLGYSVSYRRNTDNNLIDKISDIRVNLELKDGSIISTSADTELLNGESSSVTFNTEEIGKKVSIGTTFSVKGVGEQSCNSVAILCAENYSDNIGNNAIGGGLDPTNADPINNQVNNPQNTPAPPVSPSGNSVPSYQYIDGINSASYDKNTGVFSLSIGTHYIIFPKEMNGKDLNTLFPSIPTQTYISLLRNNIWQTHTSTGNRGFTNTPSPALSSGEGFKMVLNKEYSFVAQGSEFSNPANVQIHSGQNLIGIPYCSGNFVYTASKLLQELSSLNKECLTITRPSSISTSQQWYSLDNSYNAPGTRNDFAINRISAYKIDCSANVQAFTWTPNCA